MFCVVEFTINIVQVSQQVPAQGITTKSAKFYIGNHHNSTTSVPHLHHICTTSAPQLHHNFILETTTTSRQFHHSLITTTYGVLCGVFTLVKFTTCFSQCTASTAALPTMSDEQWLSVEMQSSWKQ